MLHYYIYYRINRSIQE